MGSDTIGMAARPNSLFTREHIVQAIATVLVAAITAWGASRQATNDKVEDGQFSHAAIANCQGINELREVLRDIIADAPRDPDTLEASEQFVDDALRRLETRDCSKLVNP